jgi:hypothetical protein
MTQMVSIFLTPDLTGIVHTYLQKKCSSLSPISRKKEQPQEPLRERERGSTYLLIIERLGAIINLLRLIACISTPGKDCSSRNESYITISEMLSTCTEASSKLLLNPTVPLGKPALWATACNCQNISSYNTWKEILVVYCRYAILWFIEINLKLSDLSHNIRTF